MSQQWLGRFELNFHGNRATQSATEDDVIEPKAPEVDRKLKFIKVRRHKSQIWLNLRSSDNIKVFFYYDIVLGWAVIRF